MLNELFENNAIKFGSRAAVVCVETGESISFKELNARSNQVANYFSSIGLERGDSVSFLLENNMHLIEICWAALRSGLYVTAINRFLKPREAAFVVNDCGAGILISSQNMADVAQPLAALAPNISNFLMIDGLVDGWESYEEIISRQSTSPRPTLGDGDILLYSSGTTGNPKGVRKPLPSPGQKAAMLSVAETFGWNANTMYLSTAPLYHASPLSAVCAVTMKGGTAMVMKKFDAVTTLSSIEKYRITDAQFVPTMFVRLLDLPEATRCQYDLSSLKFVVHAAAPCPVPIKHKMLEWWGPIIYEFYGATENNGMTYIAPLEWLEHPGSVGKAVLGVVRVCDDEGREVPPGYTGTIYFERDAVPFEYHNNAKATKAAQHPVHPTWTTLGDVGYLNNEGYLYLTDRKSFMIISGGVNIYPQQVEDCLIMHSKVYDVAVIGVPNLEMGEEVKAVVQLHDATGASRYLAEELIEYARKYVANYMAPRSVDFVNELPRLPTGKMYKAKLREQYWL